MGYHYWMLEKLNFIQSLSVFISVNPWLIMGCGLGFKQQKISVISVPMIRY